MPGFFHLAWNIGLLSEKWMLEALIAKRNRKHTQRKTMQTASTVRKKEVVTLGILNLTILKFYCFSLNLGHLFGRFLRL